MRRYLILIGALVFIACGDDVADEKCTGVGDCAPGERCDEGICVPSDAECVALQAPANGTVSQPDEAAAGDTANYACDEGYVLEGEATRTCQDSGQWSGEAPRCVDESDPPVHCALLDGIENGDVEQPDEASPGDTATYSCGEDWALLGDAVRTCGDDGEWSGEAPRCVEPLPCNEPLSDPENGSVDVADEPIVGDVATYSCDAGYLLVGGAVRLCDEGGNWAGEAPTCELSMCLSATSFSFAQKVDGASPIPWGFNLDGLDTTESADDKLPENGCGMPDGPDGIDNQLGTLLANIAELLDVEGAIDALIGDSLHFGASLRHTDEGTLLDFFVNDELVVDGVALVDEGAGVYSGEADVLVLDLRDLHITNVEVEDEENPDEFKEVPVVVDLKLTLNQARVAIDTATGDLILGGIVVYGDAESGEDTLRPGIAGIFAAIVDAGGSLDIPIELLDLLFAGQADMALDGENCRDISLGLRLENHIALCE